MEERLQKFLSRAGIASRRQAEEYIRSGLIRVNGQIVQEMGLKIDPAKDRVEYRGQRITAQKEHIYIMLNKPLNVVTTMKDPQGRKKVMDLLPGIKTRVYPVGRLDYRTEGLLILTNDGQLAYRLTHPGYKVVKTYLATVAGNLSRESIKILKEGVELEDGLTLPADVKVISREKGFTRLQISISEGRNRQIRRMCEAVGHPVKALKRIRFGPLELAGLQPGEYRLLGKDEINALKKACRLI
jgi:23S rRNA pseudouridine2605 synthase